MTKLTVLIGILSLLSVTEAQALSLSNIVQPYASNGAGTDWNTDDQKYEVEKHFK